MRYLAISNRLWRTRLSDYESLTKYKRPLVKEKLTRMWGNIGQL
jgi:hypothetical protein